MPIARVPAGLAQPGDVLVLSAGDTRQLRSVGHCDSPDDLVLMTWLDGRTSLHPRTDTFVRLHPSHALPTAPQESTDEPDPSDQAQAPASD